MAFPEFARFSPAFDPDRVERAGSVWRVSTLHEYPDGDLIDVCLEEEPGGMIMVSDLGDTMCWADRQVMDGGDTSGKAGLFAEVRRDFGLKWHQGNLCTRVRLGEELDDAVERLARGAERLGAGWFAPAPAREAAVARPSRQPAQSVKSAAADLRAATRRAPAAARAQPAGRKKASAGA